MDDIVREYRSVSNKLLTLLPVWYDPAMAQARTSAFRVLGVDPGLNITGYGAVDLAGGGPAIVEAGAIRTNAKADLADKITEIHTELSIIIAELKPDLVAVENLYSHYNHPRTAIVMGHARGVILLAARQAGVAVGHVAATEVKKHLTGNGHASKHQVQRAVAGLFRLAEPPNPPDVADAIAIALCAGKLV